MAALLYAALINKNVVSTKINKGRSVKVFYYFYMEKCLDVAADSLDAIISMPEKK